MDNLIAEPGFEVDPPVEWSLGGLASLDPFTVYQGSRSLELLTRDGVPPPVDSWASQSLSVTPGVTYPISMYVNGDSFGGRSTHRLEVRFRNFSTEPWQVWAQYYPADIPGPGWNLWYPGNLTFSGQSPQIRLASAVNATGGIFVGRWYVDTVSMLGAEDDPRPFRGDVVTYAQILDAAAYDAGDFSAAYRSFLRTWLDYVRIKIAEQGPWKSAYDAKGEISVSGTDPTGIYKLQSADSPAVKWAFVASNYILDVANNRVLGYASQDAVDLYDPDNDQTASQANAYWWTDAGADNSSSAGVGQIRIWPRPIAPMTIRAPAYRLLTTLDESDEQLSVDPFYGALAVWAHTFAEGLRYFQLRNDNESASRMREQLKDFLSSVRSQKRRQGVTLARTGRLVPTIFSAEQSPMQGQLDPTIYDNRQQWI